METIIRDLAETTQVRDRQGQVLTTFRGTVFTLILRVFLIGLGLLFLVGFTGLIVNIITHGISEHVSFGFMN